MILRRVVLLALLALLTVTAGAAPTRSALGNITAVLPAGWTRTEVPVADRSYVLIRPTASDVALPVLVHLQGCCTTPDAEANRTAYTAVTGPAILVYPTAYRESWNAGFCCHQAQDDRVDDVAFLTAVVRSVFTANPDADARRVFLSGYSNGGRMALRIACEAPTLFTAIASYGAVDAFPCPTPAPVALLMLAGTADPELVIGPSGTPPPVDGYTPPTVVGEVARYRTANGCTGSGSERVDGTLTTTTWTRCSSLRPVRLALYSGGDHTWLRAGSSTDTSAVIWDFFTTASAPGAGAAA